LELALNLIGPRLESMPLGAQIENWEKVHAARFLSSSGAIRARHRMQRLEPPCFDFRTAHLANSVQTSIEPLQRFIDDPQFGKRSAFDRVQRFIVLELNRSVAGVRNQRIESAL
jgi:hypothetical protein